MNCDQCREHVAAYCEQLLDAATAAGVDEHLSTCAACRREYDAVRGLIAELQHASQATPFVTRETVIPMDALVADRIIRQQAYEIRRLTMRRRIRRVGISGAVAIGLALVLVGGWMLSRPSSELRAAEVLAKAAEAMPKISTIHITGEVRTAPRDNFGYISATRELLPVEIWKHYGKRTKWRIDKPGRQIAMDGKSTIMFLKPDVAVKAPPMRRGFDTGFWHDLADVRGNLAKELQAGMGKSARLTRSEETDKDGRRWEVVTAEVESELGKDDAQRNKFFETASTRRVYWFDARTGLLERMEAYLHTDQGEDVLIFRLKEIEYNRPIDEAVFKLDLPEDVAWIPLASQVKKLPDNAKYEAMTPGEAAAALFKACAEEDWEEFEKFMPGRATPRIKRYLGGLKVLSLGEAVKLSKSYPGWFVPYEIELRNGRVRKHRIAIRKDNAARRFIVDGGL